jgi:hypothetical protein
VSIAFLIQGGGAVLDQQQTKVTFAVAPWDGRDVRLVLVHHGQHEIFRDRLDVCSSKARSRLAHQIAWQLQMGGEDMAYLLKYCHATLPALADAADEQADQLAQQTGPVETNPRFPATTCWAMREAWRRAVEHRRRLLFGDTQQ